MKIMKIGSFSFICRLHTTIYKFAKKEFKFASAFMIEPRIVIFFFLYGKNVIDSSYIWLDSPFKGTVSQDFFAPVFSSISSFWSY